MSGGYIKLWRKSQDSAVFQNAHLWQLWCWLLLEAAYEPKKVAVKTGAGSTFVDIKPGQVIFGRRTVAKHFDISPSTLRRRMLDLQLGGYVNHHMDHHFTVVTICNWEHYQNGKLKDGPPPEPPHGPPPGPPTPEIEGARVREEEKKKEDMLTDPKPKAPTPKPATTKAKQREAIAGMIYAEYPKKVGKKKAIAAIIKALASESFDVLMEAAKAYAVANEGRVDKEHIPYPATWFNQERWTDDRSTWEEWKTKQAVSRPAYQLSAMEDPG